MLSRFFYPSVGGVERHLFCLSEELIKKGFKITVIAEKNNSKLPERETIKKISIYRIDVSFCHPKLKKFVIWFWFLKHRDLIRESEIIHCHDVFFWILPFRLLYPHKPIFNTFHGWEGKFPIPKRYLVARKIWEKLSFGNISVGEFLDKWYLTKSDSIIYGGVEKKELDSRISQNENQLIIFGSRLDKDLGLEEYLQAAYELIKHGFTFKFYGDGPLKAKASRVGETPGKVKKFSSVINNARFVFSSSYLVSLESMAAKRLTFVYPTNQIKVDAFTLSPFNNLVILCRDKDEIVSKVLYYSNIKNRKEELILVNNAYSWASKQNWEMIAQEYLKVWKKRVSLPQFLDGSPTKDDKQQLKND